MQTEVLTAEVTVIPESGLEKILQDSHLELTEAEKIKTSYLPYFQQMATIKEEAKKINFENPSTLDEKIARDLRLRTVKIRTGSEGVKDERKRIHQLKANVEQQAWNLIKATCLVDEELFLQVEKKREIAEAKRKAELKAAREAEITEQCLTEFVPSVIDLGTLSDEDYTKLHAGAQMQLQQRREAAAKAELERIEREKAEAAERERVRLENEKLRAEAAEKEKQLAAERAKAEDERKRQEVIRLAEQKKADDLLEAQRKAAAKAKAESDKKLKAAEAEKNRIAAELKAKQDAEAAEEKARIAAVKKAQQAPDKEKLMVYARSLSEIPVPDINSDSCNEILDAAVKSLSELVEFIRVKVSEI